MALSSLSLSMLLKLSIRQRNSCFFAFIFYEIMYKLCTQSHIKFTSASFLVICFLFPFGYCLLVVLRIFFSYFFFYSVGDHLRGYCMAL